MGGLTRNLLTCVSPIRVVSSASPILYKPKIVNAPEGLNQIFLGRLEIEIERERKRAFLKNFEPCHLH